MTLAHIVAKSLRQHTLSTIVTALGIALATGLLMAVWVVKSQSNKSFTGVAGGFDAVLGARSAKLQLVLNSIFHLEDSPGNVAWADFEEIRKHPAVMFALPIAVGDNYRGFRLVGTTTNLFTEVEISAGHKHKMSAGRAFNAGFAEAVVGSFASQQLGLKVGDKFHPYHGLLYDEKQQHAETYVVTGILAPSNTPADRVIWIPLEGLQNMKGHAAQAASEISSVLVKLRSAMAGKQLDTLYNKQGTRLTFAWPVAQVISQLFEKLGWFDRVLALIAWLVALVASASILVSLYNSMNERRREIAILRALGARRADIFGAVILESSAIATIGALAGFAVYFVIVSAAAAIIRAQVGVVINPWAGDAVLLWAPAGIIALGAFAGIVPAVKAYRTDVAENLVPHS